mgnify:FL=1
MSDPAQVPLPLAWPARADAAAFVLGPANAQAAAWLAQPQLWPMPRTLLVGPPGSGKSHLAGLFARGHAATVIDDAETRDPEFLFHAWNAATPARPLLLTAATRHWPHGLPDLASRLAATPQVQIGDPDDALLAALMAKQFTDRGLTVGDDVLAWLVRRMERSFAAAAETVARLDAAALAQRRAITVPLAREVLDGQGALAL